nr:phospho-sugar mutase [bacterium]
MDTLHARSEARRWLASSWLEPELRPALEAMDEDAIALAFGGQLSFGTAGLRGIIGPGTARMNVHTVRRATQALAGVILAQPGGADRGVAISYDTRHMSRTFALSCAEVLCASGIRVYLFTQPSPVPMLSFAVRETGAQAGIMITASHNPGNYNGYKVYWQDGCQLPPGQAEEVARRMRALSFGDEKRMPADEARQCGLLADMPVPVIDAYFAAIQAACPPCPQLEGGNIDVVYTPLHGTGRDPVCRTMRDAAFTHLHMVAAQAVEDADFSTTPSPNPEDERAFTLALEDAKALNAALIVGTDPDCDRVAVMVLGKDRAYHALTGNQLGALLLDYLIGQLKQNGRLPPNPAVVKTIVTTTLARKIAEDAGCTVFDVLTGFKFIGELMGQWEQNGEHRFIFGYEESCGFLAGTHARDKDGVIAARLAIACAAHHAAHGRTLLDALEGLYARHGYFYEKTLSIAFNEADTGRMARMMGALRAHPPKCLGNLAVLAVRDYQSGLRTDAGGARSALDLPQSDVLYFELEDGCWACIRPSGTEPKCKVYLAAHGNSHALAQARLQALIGDQGRLTGQP